MFWIKKTPEYKFSLVVSLLLYIIIRILEYMPFLASLIFLGDKCQILLLELQDDYLLLLLHVGGL